RVLLVLVVLEIFHLVFVQSKFQSVGHEISLQRSGTINPRITFFDKPANSSSRFQFVLRATSADGFFAAGRVLAERTLELVTGRRCAVALAAGRRRAEDADVAVRRTGVSMRGAAGINSRSPSCG